MDPLIATMDQSSIGNKNKILTSSGPNAKEQNSKLMHKTDQDLTSPIILSPSATNVVVPSSFDEFRPKNNHFSAPNNRCSNNHRSPLGDADYDDNKDVIIVREQSNKDISRNHKDSGISSKIEKLSMTEESIMCTNPVQSKHCGSKKTEGTSTSSQIPVNTIALNRTSTTTITPPPPPSTITSTTNPAISRSDDIVAKSRDSSEACNHHQALSSTLPASAIPPATSNGGTRGGNHHHVIVGGMTALQQQRRQPPIIKAQSLDLGCVDDRVNSHHLNSQYMFQSNHHYHYHRNHLHSQHPHHYHHVSTNQQSSSARKQKPINIGCSLDNQRSEDEDGPRSSIIAATLTTEDVDADVDEDDDEEIATKRVSTLTTNSLRNHSTSEGGGDALSSNHRSRGSVDSTSSTGDTTDSSQPTDGARLPSPQPRQHALAKGILPKVQSLESRPIYPNVPYSPYASPYGSPRSNRRRTPLRESRRISIEQSGSFLQLNQYKLMDQIGQGSYGLVKLAYSEEDSTHYAMKILSKRRLLRKAGLMSRGPKKTTSPLDRVYREIAVLKKLDHPNVVKLVEVLDDPLEDSLYLVFELVKQGEVLGIPTDKPLTEERAWSVFRDAVLGLEYLHYQRIIHADIKPGNLLLTECGHVKIADLGVCNEFLGEDATMNNGSTAGTPAFRAPETLFPGQHLYSGKAADIWALGATLYSLVYGNVPFVASSVPLLYEKIKNETLMIPEQPVVSEELVDLIKKLLTKDPAKRITLPQIKEHPWMTSNGKLPLPSEDDNCRLVQVSEEDINSVVKSIPKLDTLILIKTMLKNHSFLNPFSRGISGRAPQRGGSRLERFTRAGRSNSAPGAYHSPIDRQLSADCILPALSEHGVSSNNDIAEDF